MLLFINVKELGSCNGWRQINPLQIIELGVSNVERQGITWEGFDPNYRYYTQQQKNDFAKQSMAAQITLVNNEIIYCDESLDLLKLRIDEALRSAFPKPIIETIYETIDNRTSDNSAY